MFAQSGHVSHQGGEQPHVQRRAGFPIRPSAVLVPAGQWGNESVEDVQDGDLDDDPT